MVSHLQEKRNFFTDAESFYTFRLYTICSYIPTFNKKISVFVQLAHKRVFSKKHIFYQSLIKGF